MEPIIRLEQSLVWSSLGYLMYLNKKDPTRVQELLQQLQQLSPLLKEATAAALDNPRLLETERKSSLRWFKRARTGPPCAAHFLMSMVTTHGLPCPDRRLRV